MTVAKAPKMDFSQFDIEKSGPLYLNLAETVAEMIHNGQLHTGDALPPQREWAQQLQVSVVTVRKALEQLVSMGLVVKKHGAGCFVQAVSSQEMHKPLSVLNGFSEDTRARGMEPSSQVISTGVYMANSREIMALNLTPGSKVSRLCRLRLGDGEPLAYEISTYPVEVLPDPSLVQESTYQLLEQRNMRPVRALQSISAKNATQEIAELLGIAPQQAVLYIERQGLLAENKLIEFTISYYRSDKYDFVTELGG